MIFTGHFWKEGKFWVIIVPSFEITTQGRSKKEALLMIADAIECHVDRPDFKVKVGLLAKNVVSISSNNEARLIALFLKRQRQLNKLTVRELTKRLGYASPSAYAQYESGKHIPGLDKISRFITAMNPKTAFTVDVVAQL